MEIANHLAKPNTQNYRHMSVNIQPLADRVLVETAAAEEKTASGIIIPDTAKEKPQEAEVVALGTGGKDENGNDIQFSVEAGNKVLISKYGGTDVKVDGADLLIINEGDILGVIAD